MSCFLLHVKVSFVYSCFICYNKYYGSTASKVMLLDGNTIVLWYIITVLYDYHSHVHLFYMVYKGNSKTTIVLPLYVG